MLKRNLLLGLVASVSFLNSPLSHITSCYSMESLSSQKQSLTANYRKLMNDIENQHWLPNLDDVTNIKDAIVNILGVNQAAAEQGIARSLIPSIFAHDDLIDVLNMPVRLTNAKTNATIKLPFSSAAPFMAARYGDGKYKALGLQRRFGSGKFIVCPFMDINGNTQVLTIFGLMHSLMEYVDKHNQGSSIARKIRDDLLSVQLPTLHKSTNVGTEKGKQIDFISYISAFSMPEKVKTLALTGHQNYDSGSKLALARGSGGKKAGGRTYTWIEDTFGQDEASIIAQLKGIPAPRTWTLNDIDQAYRSELQKHPKGTSTTPPTFIMVKGLSVNDLHDHPRGQNSILQLASQFNYLESPGPYQVDVLKYVSDMTQGPQGSIEAAAAALHRTAAVKAGTLQHSLIDVLPANSEGYYQHGYLELLKAPDLITLKDFIHQNIGKMRILAQWALCEPSGGSQLQVFSAAPSFQNQPAPVEGSPAAQISDELVSAQYEAIAKIAVIQSLKYPDQPINAHLTLVGQGAFNNPRSAMTLAFSRVADIVRGFPNVYIYIHGWGAGDQTLIRNAVTNAGNAQLMELTKEEFMS